MYLEILVFLGAHSLLLFFAMVVIADKMKQSVYDDPVEFLGKVCLIINGVFPYRIDADEKVAGESVSFAVIKGNYVGKIIVLKILFINLKDVVVGAENYIDLPEFFHFQACNGLKPGVVLTAALEPEISILKEIVYHIAMNSGRKVRK